MHFSFSLVCKHKAREAGGASPPSGFPRPLIFFRFLNPLTWAGQNVALLVFQGRAQAGHAPILGLRVVANALPVPNAPAAVSAALGP